MNGTPTPQAPWQAVRERKGNETGAAQTAPLVNLSSTMKIRMPEATTDSKNAETSKSVNSRLQNFRAKNLPVYQHHVVFTLSTTLDRRAVDEVRNPQQRTKDRGGNFEERKEGNERGDAGQPMSGSQNVTGFRILIRGQASMNLRNCRKRTCVLPYPKHRNQKGFPRPSRHHPA